ncbi:Peptidyl-prolyl cis-trans isomerase FKBP13, chloroplastic [Linum perenne]
MVERESPSDLSALKLKPLLAMAAMNSLAISLPRYTPKLRTKTIFMNAQTTEPSSSSSSSSTTVKYSAHQNQLQLNQDSISIGRRETLGLGFCAAFFDGLLLQWKPTAEAAEAAPCELASTPSGLAFCDKVLGTGPEAVKGQLIKAHYVGKLENGQVFDSSYNRGKPLTFRVGVGEVIQGWDKGIVGGDGIPSMQAGGKRVLKIPPELGYGVRGAGCRGGSCIIPPNSVLVFDVEFIGKA